MASSEAPAAGGPPPAAAAALQPDLLVCPVCLGAISYGALRAVACGILFECRPLVVEDLLRFVQQPSDQRRLAVVHAAAGDEAQRFPHQKYPSFFLRSIEAALS